MKNNVKVNISYHPENNTTPTELKNKSYKTLIYKNQFLKNIIQAQKLLSQTLNLTLPYHNKTVLLPSAIKPYVQTAHYNQEIIHLLQTNNPITNIFLKIFQQAAAKTHQKNNDGSATTILLANILLQNILKNNFNVNQYQQQIIQAAQIAKNNILQNAAPIQNTQQLLKIANTIAPQTPIQNYFQQILQQQNNPTNLTQSTNPPLLSNLFIQESNQNTIQIQYKQNFFLPITIIHYNNYIRTNTNSSNLINATQNIAAYINPLFLFSNYNLPPFPKILPILNNIHPTPLFLIANDFNHPFILQTYDYIQQRKHPILLIPINNQNNQNSSLNANLINANPIQALQIITNAQNIDLNQDYAPLFQNIQPNQNNLTPNTHYSPLGTAQKAIVYKQHIEIQQNPNHKNILQAKKQLQKQIQQEDNPIATFQYQQQLQLLTPNPIVLSIGDNHPTLQKYYFDTAIKIHTALQNAQKIGFSPASYTAYMKAAFAIQQHLQQNLQQHLQQNLQQNLQQHLQPNQNSDPTPPFLLVHDSLKQAAFHLHKNANPHLNATPDLEKRYQQIVNNNDYFYGFSITKQKFGNLEELDEIEPTITLVDALDNALSAALTIANLEVLLL